MVPQDVVDQQVAAYNARDAIAFASFYAEDIHVFMMPNLKLVVRGRENLRTHYAENVFTKSGLRAEVVSRQVLGNKVIDHERTHGFGDKPLEIIAIYEVENSLIQAVWFYWPSATYTPSSAA